MFPGVFGIASLLFSLTPAWGATPFRAPRPKPTDVVWQEGLEKDVVLVKVVEGSPRVPTVPGATTRPLFSRSPEALRADRQTFDPEGRLADLTTWWRLETSAGNASEVARLLNQQPWVERAQLALVPSPPPMDLEPATPDLTGHQEYLRAAPVGFGFDEASRWPAGDGRHVTVADLEYSWLPTHEDLEAASNPETWGHDTELYQSHGTAVLAQLVAGDNGYGVVGMVPASTPLVVHPYVDADNYNIADAIDGAVALLEPGDVLLIEQQVYDPTVGAYLPVEWESATFDAISLAVAKGIVVVEPAANGGQNLDDPLLEGWFDREERDSGAILVGGGNSPNSGLTPRNWTEWGSNYGGRVDVQGWYDSVATAWTNLGGNQLADLFLPEDGDPRQGYTSQFGGTSAASPMVAAVCAVANSVAIELHGVPFEPLDLRVLLVTTGTPQPAEDAGVHPIGPQPDLRAVLRYGLLP